MSKQQKLKKRKEVYFGKFDIYDMNIFYNVILKKKF